MLILLTKFLEGSRNLFSYLIDFILKCLRGFYPKGGGEVHLSIEPIEHLKSVEILELSPMANFKGECWVAGVLPPKVCYEDLLKCS